jgi:ATPase subunit of ABC transporter with duplicated ATPase domains
MVSYQPAWHTAGVSIRAENLTFSYGAKAILDRACFTIDSTRVNCLVGRMRYFRQSVPLDVTSLRRELSHYQFTEDGVFSRMRSLSAGERVRVFLVLFALSRANLLLLDEPTNNLDPQSRERLIDALANYAGTLLVVSHDEPFLSELSIDKTLRAGEGAVRVEYGLTR